MKNKLDWHPATVRAHRDLSPTVREFELRPEGGVKAWTVGSHLNVEVHIDGRRETRSYSLVGLPQGVDAAEVYRIAVKRAKPGRGGSRFMWAWRPAPNSRSANRTTTFSSPSARRSIC